MVTNECLYFFQADYEQELAVQKSGHEREMALSKEEMLQLLDNAESAESNHLDEATIRERYMTDIDRIKVRAASIFFLFCLKLNVARVAGLTLKVEKVQVYHCRGFH